MITYTVPPSRTPTRPFCPSFQNLRSKATAFYYSCSRFIALPLRFDIAPFPSPILGSSLHNFGIITRIVLLGPRRFLIIVSSSFFSFAFPHMQYSLLYISDGPATSTSSALFSPLFSPCTSRPRTPFSSLIRRGTTLMRATVPRCIFLTPPSSLSPSRSLSSTNSQAHPSAALHRDEYCIRGYSSLKFDAFSVAQPFPSLLRLFRFRDGVSEQFVCCWLDQ